ncbi:MAG: Maf family protein [Candidatus Cloacimonetes bacterium]|nr:Maf family protein [Candidatus Cloacimonadota bacterium]
MLHKILEPYNIILASASPRRAELLKLLGLEYTVRVSNVDEPENDDEPAQQAIRHAMNKAVAISLNSGERDMVIAADTIVVLDGRILGKPEHEDMAAHYLKQLSGREHIVITAICVSVNNRLVCDHEQSRVRFAELSDTEITEYVASKEPMDKAGAYGIQGLGSQFISEIEGCYFNVMGFPIHKFYRLVNALRQEGLL